MDQLHKCFENKHAPNIKVYISPFGNIERSGFLVYYGKPGVNLTYWDEISFQQFAEVAYPEALSLIDFIIKHKRLPIYAVNEIPYEYRK